MIKTKIVRVHDETYDELNERKIIPDESFDSVISRLLKAKIRR